MYTRILVPLDGSERALAALGPARRLARLHGAELGVVTVAGPASTVEELDAIVEAGRQVAGEPVGSGIVLRGADAASALARFDREHPETLLCLTTRARRPLGRAILGSVAREVVGGSEQALVLVGPRCDVADAGDVRQLIVCLDGTQSGEVILSWATRWSTAASLSLVLVRVQYPLVDPAARVPPTEEQIDELGYVRRVALRLERDGHRVTDVTVQHPSTPDALVDFGSGVPKAFLAVSTADVGPVTESLEGSVAAQVVRSSSVPVLIARHTSA